MSLLTFSVKREKKNYNFFYFAKNKHHIKKTSALVNEKREDETKKMKKTKEKKHIFKTKQILPFSQ